MSPRANLFPDLAVSSLHDSESAQTTVPTDAVRKVGAVVRRHLEAVSRQEAGSVIARVEGEFGSGKTHLLLVGRQQLEAESVEFGLRAPFVVAAAATRSDPVGWYRTDVGPELEEAGLADLLTDVYGSAAASVARLSVLTTPAADLLKRTPSAAVDLVERELLNSTAVEAEFVDVLDGTCAGAPDTVRLAMRLVVGAQQRPAVRWLAGRSLSDRDVAVTGLTRTIADEGEVLGVLTSTAALARRSDRPFMFLADELEHFIGEEAGADAAGNSGWLKRLLEALAPRGAFVLLAGHTSAWTGRRDLPDRFTPASTVLLQPLGGQEVLEAADLFSGDARTIDEDTAAAIAERCGGNVRMILGVLRLLYDATDGFSVRPSTASIEEAASDVGSRVSPDEAMRGLEGLLRQLGFDARRDQALASGIAAELVAERSGSPTIVFERHRAAYQRKQHDQFQTFLDRLLELRRQHPALVGMFLSEGSLDERVAARVADRSAEVYAFDLTAADFLTRIRPVVAEIADRPSSTREPEAPKAAGRRERETRALQDDVQELSESDAPLYDELEARHVEDVKLPAMDAALGFEETRDETRRLYEHLTERPAALRSLGVYLSWRQTQALLMVAVTSVVVLILANDIVELFLGPGPAERLSLRFIAIMLLASSVLGLFRVFMSLTSYYGWRSRVLRDMLIRRAPAEELVRVASVIDEAAEESRGPRHARTLAAESIEPLRGESMSSLRPGRW